MLGLRPAKFENVQIDAVIHCVGYVCMCVGLCVVCVVCVCVCGLCVVCVGEEYVGVCVREIC